MEASNCQRRFTKTLIETNRRPSYTTNEYPQINTTIAHYIIEDLICNLAVILPFTDTIRSWGGIAHFCLGYIFPNRSVLTNSCSLPSPDAIRTFEWKLQWIFRMSELVLYYLVMVQLSSLSTCILCFCYFVTIGLEIILIYWVFSIV